MSQVDSEQDQSVGSVPERIGRRYAVRGVIHGGTSAWVLDAVDRLHPERAVVLKCVTGHPTRSERARRLETEYRLLAELRHPGLPEALDFGFQISDDLSYLVMTRAPGRQLTEQIPLGAEEAVAIAIDLARVLSLLHARGRLHLDVKPGNVVRAAEPSARTTLLDLDLAAFPESAAGRGTPPYVAPEIMGAPGPVDQRADIFSLGVTLWEMLTGGRLGTELPESLDPGTGVPGWLRELVAAMTAADPRDRPADAREVITRLGGPEGSVPPESRETRLAILGRPPLVGRRAATKAILEALPAVRQAAPRAAIVLVQGPTGVGKSRLVDAASAAWHAGGFRVVRIDPGPVPRVTLAPARRLVRTLKLLADARSAEDDSESGSDMDRQGLCDRIAEEALTLARPVRTILCFEGLQHFDAASRDVVLHLLRRIHHELTEEGGRPPVGVVLSRESRREPVDALDRFLDATSESEHRRTVELEPLDRASCDQLVRAMVAPEKVSASVREFLFEQTGGRPFYLRETLALHPSRPDGSGSLLGSLASELPSESQVPGTVEEVVRRNLDQLSPRERAVLEALAVFTEGATRDDLAALDADDERALSSLLARGYLRPTDGRYHLHDLAARDVIEASSDPDRLATLHAYAAKWIACGGTSPHAVSYHLLRSHDPWSGLDGALQSAPRLIASGRWEEAQRLLRTLRDLRPVSPFAARRAALLLADLWQERGRLMAARELLERYALRPWAPDVAARTRLARVAHRQGLLGEARAILEDLLGLRAELAATDRLQIKLELAEMLFESGHSGDAARTLESAAAHLCGVVPLERLESPSVPLPEVRAPRFRWPDALAPEVARYLAVRAELARVDRDHATALRCQLAVLKLRSRLGDLRGVARALHGIGTIFMAGQSHELAERYLERAFDLRKELGDLAGMADTANNLGVLKRSTGRMVQAVDHFRASLRLRKQIGHAAGEVFSYINIANLHLRRRELEAATRYYEKALAVARGLDDVRSQAQILNNLGVVAHLEAGHGRAVRCFREAQALDRAVGNLSGALVRRLNLAEDLLVLGCQREARRLLETVRRALGRRGESGSGLHPRLALLEGRAAAAAGDLGRARELLASAEAEAREGEDPDAVVEVAIEIAAVAVARGHPSEGRALLPGGSESAAPEVRAALAAMRARAGLEAGAEDLAELLSEVTEAERGVRRSRMPGYQHSCAWMRARLQRRLGDDVQALRAYTAAYGSLESIVAQLDDAELLRSFLDTPAVSAFVEDVRAFATTLSPGGGRRLSVAGGAVFNRLREALFEADRRLGTTPERPSDYEETIWRILEVSRALRSTAPLNDLLRQVVDGVVEFSGAERGFVIVVDERGRLSIPMARTSSGEAIPQPESQISRRITEEVLRNGRGIRLNNAMAEDQFSMIESVVNLELRSIMCSPLLRGKQVVGMLYVDNRSRTGQFGAPDLELLEFFAAQVAIALENARLVREFVRDEKIRVLGSLAGGVAHDFNNLLTAILGRTQRLAERVRDPELLKDVTTIETAALDGAEAVRRMQGFTRLQQNGERVSVSLAELVTDVLEFTRARWEGEALRRGHRIEIRRAVDPGLHVVGNPSELREVFTNLVLNAVTAMPEGGRLGIVAEAAGEQVRIEVRDNGIGMTEEVRESVFDPYFTTRAHEGGTGLGMSIVYGILLGHGGAITVDSTPGQGTRIEVTLPRARPPKEGEPMPRAGAAPQGARGHSVLVVDDEAGVRELLRDVLDGAGFAVTVVEDGARAIETFERHPTDAVITDLGMVPVTGWDVAHAVKSRQPEAAVIMITGWGGEIDPDNPRSCDVDCIVAKPFDVPALVRTLLSLLEEPSPEVR